LGLNTVGWLTVIVSVTNHGRKQYDDKSIRVGKEEWYNANSKANEDFAGITFVRFLLSFRLKQHQMLLHRIRLLTVLSKIAEASLIRVV
jgi:hypothetical protein